MRLRTRQTIIHYSFVIRNFFILCHYVINQLYGIITFFSSVYFITLRDRHFSTFNFQFIIHYSRQSTTFHSVSLRDRQLSIILIHPTKINSTQKDFHLPSSFFPLYPLSIISNGIQSSTYRITSSLA